MALSNANIECNNMGRFRAATGRITFPNPYVSGGIDMAPTLKEARILNLQFIDFEDVATYDFRYDRSAKKVLVYTKGTNAEAGAVDLSAVTTYFFAIGR